MTQWNNNGNYQQAPYNQPVYAQTDTQPAGGELMEGQSVSAAELGDYDQGYILLPDGDYNFTVVSLETSRYQPGPNSSGKIGPCKQITLTLRVIDQESGKNVDLRHNLYMFNNQGCLGMIAQFYDSIGLHKKGDPIVFDWRQEVIIGKTGLMAINQKSSNKDPNVKYNNIKKLYPFGTEKQQAIPTLGNPIPNAGQWSIGKF